MASDSVKKTLTVALLLCLVCSVLVSFAAVGLRPQFLKNKDLDRKKNILMAAGLYQEGQDVAQLFQKIEPQVVELETGNVVPRESVDPAAYDPSKAPRIEKYSHNIPAGQDLAGIKARAKYAMTYLVKENGQTTQVILPVYGKGLWSTLYGFVALDTDLQTVKGFGFYQHGETPGLGGEVDNPQWKNLWPGKHVLNNQGEPIIQIVKGDVPHGTPEALNKVDALSGATITSNGVENLLHYWLGENGFGPYLAKLKTELQGSSIMEEQMEGVDESSETEISVEEGEDF